jgi:ribonuclease D
LAKYIGFFFILDLDWITGMRAIDDGWTATSEHKAVHVIETSLEVDALVQETCIGIDMEFMTCVWDERKNRYSSEKLLEPKLCLIQISTRSGEVFVVDVLACQMNLQPFWLLMGNKRVEKVVHDGREEVMRCFEQSKEARVLPRNLFDTQIASRFADPLLLNGVVDLTPSLQSLVGKYANVALDKTLQTSNWAKRPLTKQQLEYAANDVRFLIIMRDRLDELMRCPGRDMVRDCFSGDCDSLCNFVETKAESKANPIFEYLGRQEWTSKQYANLVGLVKWRERNAQESGRYEKRIMTASNMVSIARNASDEELLHNCNGFRRGIAPLGGVVAETASEYLQNDYCFSLCKSLCLSYGIYPEAVPLGARPGYAFVYLMGHLRRSKAFPVGHFLSKGWRLRLVGQPLLEFVCHNKVISLSL